MNKKNDLKDYILKIEKLFLQLIVNYKCHCFNLEIIIKLNGAKSDVAFSLWSLHFEEEVRNKVNYVLKALRNINRSHKRNICNYFSVLLDTGKKNY